MEKTYGERADGFHKLCISMWKNDVEMKKVAFQTQLKNFFGNNYNCGRGYIMK